jgi:hypothetical protein
MKIIEKTFSNMRPEIAFTKSRLINWLPVSYSVKNRVGFGSVCRPAGLQLIDFQRFKKGRSGRMCDPISGRTSDPIFKNHPSLIAAFRGAATRNDPILKRAFVSGCKAYRGNGKKYFGPHVQLNYMKTTRVLLCSKPATFGNAVLPAVLSRQLEDRTETYTALIEGNCKCGQPVVKVENSNCTHWSNGNRFHYPNENTAWNIFRCKECGECIHETFQDSSSQHSVICVAEGAV